MLENINPTLLRLSAGIPSAAIGGLLGYAMGPKDHRLEAAGRGASIGYLGGTGMGVGMEVGSKLSPEQRLPAMLAGGLTGGAMGLGVGNIIQGEAPWEKRRKFREELLSVLREEQEKLKADIQSKYAPPRFLQPLFGSSTPPQPAEKQSSLLERRADDTWRPRVRVMMPLKNSYLLERLNNPKYPENMGKLRFPGGGVDPGETLQEAAVRELREELSLNTTADKLKYVGQDSRPDKNYEHYLRLDDHKLKPDFYKTTAGGDDIVQLIAGTTRGKRYFGANVNQLIPAEKQSASPIIQTLLQAKELSDRRDYKGKHAKLRSLIEQYPDDFYIDSRMGDIVGLTHKSGFRIHAPSKIIPIPLRGVTSEEYSTVV